MAIIIAIRVKSKGRANAARMTVSSSEPRFGLLLGTAEADAAVGLLLGSAEGATVSGLSRSVSTK